MVMGKVAWRLKQKLDFRSVIRDRLGLAGLNESKVDDK